MSKPTKSIDYQEVFLWCFAGGLFIILSLFIYNVFFDDTEVVETANSFDILIEMEQKQLDILETLIEEPEEELTYTFTDDDILLLAQLLCGDKAVSGDGEYDIDYQKDINHYEVNKVLSVVMNRVRDDRFPDTIQGVILARNQFSVMPKNLNANPSLTALKVVKDWCDIYAINPGSVQAVPDDHVYFSGNGKVNTTRR